MKNPSSMESETPPLQKSRLRRFYRSKDLKAAIQRQISLTLLLNLESRGSAPHGGKYMTWCCWWWMPHADTFIQCNACVIEAGKLYGFNHPSGTHPSQMSVDGPGLLAIDMNTRHNSPSSFCGILRSMSISSIWILIYC